MLELDVLNKADYCDKIGISRSPVGFVRTGSGLASTWQQKNSKDSGKLSVSVQLTSRTMMMPTKWSSVAAAVVLVIVYLCHVTADDAPARSRPPGMLFHLLTRAIAFVIMRRDRVAGWWMRHKGKARQARFGASNPTLGVTSIVASQDCNEYLYSPEKSGSNKKNLIKWNTYTK